MSNPFFDHPILNSPYQYPVRHWELDDAGQPTQQIVEDRRRAKFITPIIARGGNPYSHPLAGTHHGAVECPHHLGSGRTGRRPAWSEMGQEPASCHAWVAEATFVASQIVWVSLPNVPHLSIDKP
jgi:hypothetical protein